VEPQALPIKSPDAMAIEAMGDGSLAAVIDSSGALSLLALDADGMVRSNTSVISDVTISGVAIAPGAERVLAVRSDQRVLLLDRDGKELSRLSLRSARVVYLHATADGAVAILRRTVDNKSRFEVRRLAMKDDGLSWRGEAHTLPLAVTQSPQVSASVSPDGALLGFVGSVEGGTSEVRIVEVETGAEVKLDDTVPVVVPASTTIGFTADRRLEIGGMNGGGAWRIEIDGKTGVAVGSATASGHTVPAYAKGLRVTSYNNLLYLHADDGDSAFLGHREMSPSTGSLSPDGSVAAWVTTSGAIVVQRFDGTDDLRIKTPGDWWGSVAVIDDRHLLAGRQNGELVLFDSKTGAQLDSKVVAQSTPWFWYEPKTRLVAVLRESGVVWAVPIDPKAKAPIGAPIAVNDGAYNFMLLDPDLSGGAALMTIDSMSQTHEYTLEQLADGVSAKEAKQKRDPSYSAWAFDRAGHTYTSTGTAIEVRKGTTLVASIKVDQATGSIFAAPDGRKVAVGVTDPSGVMGIKMVDREGKHLWTARSPRNGIFNVLWSADGKRCILVSSGAGTVVDADTGEVIAQSNAWGFSLTNEVPQTFPPGVEPELTVVTP
jgi:hypothetical protein